ncbi:SMI1/KNR4 family protein [Actinomadura rudentiformis]|uniref:SMI1/KNR4 family protein n=1 Tax=Actinomadura rudentiformis TaxID=359158 RepID=A0A6H9YTN5_9ACTN|nr:SMI1/KNR4 family protein [Actinomadura rudentiformis]KAB2347530.1 SMI1/KNR4 family protein [Actinomadura rudentiformis]
MDDLDLVGWRESVEASMASLLVGFQDRMGYPPSDNHLGEPAPADDVEALAVALDGRLPDSLGRFYASVGEVHLPDFWNALFITAPSRMLADIRADEVPRRITGAYDMDVLAFGDDGGGARFLLGIPEGGPVFKAPLAATVGGLYETNTEGFRRLADDLTGFLRLVERELHQWATQGSPPSFF